VTATSLDPPANDLVTIDVAGDARQTRVTAVGEIDSSSAPLFRERLEPLLDGDVAEITVDLTAVTFLDSAGLCVLAAAHRRAVASGKTVRVLASSRAVIRPLQITGLWELLQVENVSAKADQPPAQRGGSAG
jgi:anti-sigma B factor antagonist